MKQNTQALPLGPTGHEAGDVAHVHSPPRFPIRRSTAQAHQALIERSNCQSRRVSAGALGTLKKGDVDPVVLARGKGAKCPADRAVVPEFASLVERLAEPQEHFRQRLWPAVSTRSCEIKEPANFGWR